MNYTKPKFTAGALGKNAHTNYVNNFARSFGNIEEELTAPGPVFDETEETVLPEFAHFRIAVQTEEGVEFACKNCGQWNPKATRCPKSQKY